MFAPLACLVLMSTCGVDDAAVVEESQREFLMRVESSPLFDSQDRPYARIERNADGEITALTLNEMTLEAGDYAIIGRIETLEHLVLFRCAVTDADVEQLSELSQLKSLNLTSTEITDASLDTIAGLPSLRSLCLGNVVVTPEAVDWLKAQFEANDRELGLGYSQRR